MNEAKSINSIKIQLISLIAIPIIGLLIVGWMWHAEAAALGATTGFKPLITIAIIMAITVGIGSYIIRALTLENNALNEALSAIAKGDLSQAAADYEQINGARSTLQQMRDNLTKITEQLQSTTQRVKDNSREIAENNTLLAQRAEQQASNLERTSASMEEITTTVAQNADDAKQGNVLSQQAMEHAMEGKNIVSRAINAMTEINDDSKKIADIIGLIDDIAFQTNLLALNAAVEAARAGDQGRGFAVVATEVRNLAGRSAQAAKEIKTLIEESVTKIERGSEMVRESGESLDGIVNSVQNVLDIMDKISTASVEQATGISQINQSMLELDESNQQNTSMVEEVAVASKELLEQANALANISAFFKLDASSARKARFAPPQQPSKSALPQAVKPDTAPTPSSKDFVERRSADRPWGQTTATPAPASNPVPKAAGSNEDWDNF